MSRTIYTLLVGIDEYPAPVPPLRGCVNDITAVEQLLRARLAAGRQLDLKVLKNNEATRQAVIDGFAHLRQAGPDDVALFYYSGHGSQERTPPEFWHLEPDRLDETLVCYDSRLPGNYDLADKELAKLIAAVAARGAHVLIVLDSCHSGSGTRAGDTEGVRRVPTDLRERPLNTFLVTPEEAAAMAAQSESKDVAGTRADWVKLPQGRHVVMAACRDDEEAKETNAGGIARGAFSYFLTETLQRAGADMTYRDLFKRVNALVRTRAARQSPVIEAPQASELNQPFLGGAIQPHSPYFTVSFDAKDGWVVDGGAVHGIAAVSGAETTFLAIFPVEASAEQLGNLQAAIGEARVTERQPTRSKIALQVGDGSQAPDSEMTYKAVVVATPLAPLGVQICGDGMAAELARTAFSDAGPGAGPSLLVREVAEGAELKLIASDDGYRIMRATDGRPLVVDIHQAYAADARKAVDRLEHIARWLRVAELANPTTRIKPDEIELIIELLPDANAPIGAASRVFDVAARGSELRLDYVYHQGEWREPQFKVRLKNNSTQRLYCVLLDLTETYKITSELLPGGGIWLDPGAETYALAGEPIFANIPNNLWKQGVGEIKDLLKLIVSTDECDATLLDQDELDVSLRDAATRGEVAPRNTLERLMRRTQTRDFSARPQGDRLADWTTKEVSVTTIRPLETVTVPSAGEVPLLPHVTLAGHPSFKAKASLSTSPQGNHELKVSVELSRVTFPDRDLRVPRMPSLLRDDPNIVRPLQFSASRSGEPGLSVLELTHINEDTVNSVTADQPLVMRFDQSLASENEHILPVGYDGEFFLPLGRARRAGNVIEVNIERLPPPLVDSRSLTGSIRIFFEKVICERTGREFTYPRLAIAESDGEGCVKYNTGANAISARIAAANKILLYVHGIIGDTSGMAASARHGLMVDPPIALLADRYDLILAFDYESLNTPIEQNARKLKELLAAVGLGAGHGKQFHIAAHSMGGLVSRWFIERDGGNQVVQHLVMLGTPNAGSPWPTVEDLVTTLIGFGLNNLTPFAWPAKVLGWLVGDAGRIDVSLDQMNPKSDFMRQLAESPDPGVRYTIIAGDTALVARADDAQKGRLERLIGRLKPQRLLHGATGLLFFGAPNDIAVSVTSIKSVPDERAPGPQKSEIACDHISYFSTEAGLRALAEALQ